jgi:hypothetical protein
VLTQNLFRLGSQNQFLQACAPVRSEHEQVNLAGPDHVAKNLPDISFANVAVVRNGFQVRSQSLHSFPGVSARRLVHGFDRDRSDWFGRHNVTGL